MRKWIIVAAALAVAACQPDPPQNDADLPMGDNGLNYTAAIMALEPSAREGVFLRAIRDAGLPCQGVTATEQVSGEGLVAHKSFPTWRATCTSGAQHLIQVTPDGTAKIVSRP